MLCQTIKSGVECSFMTKGGCGFFGGSCVTVIEKCDGCNKVLESSTGKFCRVYPDPTAKWAIGGCPTASHIKKGSERRTEDQSFEGIEESQQKVESITL